MSKQNNTIWQFIVGNEFGFCQSQLTKVFMTAEKSNCRGFGTSPPSR